MFGNFSKIFASKKKFLGVDIGTLNIKIVEMKTGGKMPVLENYGELGIVHSSGRLFRAFEKETLLLSDYDLAKAIRAICDEANIETRDANFSIPDFSSFFTTLSLPAMAKEEISGAIRFEIRPYIPVPLSEITLDWVVTEGEVGKTAAKVLVVAVPNNIINQYKEIARISRLNLRMVEPEVFALVRSLKFIIKSADGKNVFALIDIGARSTTCSILDGEVLKISDSFNIGAGAFLESLARTLNMDYNKAEELQIKYGLIPGSEPYQSDVSRVLTSSFNELIDEIERSFKNFSQAEGKDVTKIILAGGMAFLPGLKEYLSKKLNKEVTIGDPFVNMSYNPILTEILKKRGPSYSIAVGLALKGLEK